ncbi:MULTISPECIES: hypothetical protein [Acinetobacter]|mgnify:FL=1|uniref:hypothetical protein n=1 Tax=Acinetobacter TaxID=469 RepID=UPI000CA91F4F|nr:MULTISPECIES: hypothetical protein [Acinetobacter]MCU4359035.1 hypothetical protein [Acinetobacter ursingii]PMC95976.1 hypothetical protein CJ183_14330 [Acinetobacter ursingii]QQT91893.1 hypothetical protein I6I51_00035 [Acinetobacter johnsonii]BBF79325.1 copper resistance protein B [Acinetobacter ursingii]
MKTVVRRSLTILMCAGTLIAGTQSWAKDVSTSSATKTVKAQEPCTKPCKMEKDDKTQQDHSQHQSPNSSDMSKMDHSMMNMDHSKMDHSMMNMDHSKMDHSKMNMPSSNK